VTRVDDRRISEWKQDASNRPQQRRQIASRQVSAADRSSEQRIADKQVRRVGGFDCQTHATRAVTGRVMRFRGKVAEANDLSRFIEAIDRRLAFDVKAKEPAMFHGVVVQKQIIAVEVNRHIEGAFRGAHAGHVIDVRVGQKNTRQLDLLPGRVFEQAVDLITRIDEHAFPRPRAGDDESVLEEWADGLRLDYDHEVILAILDDLLFTSKMRATAKQIGATLAVAKSRESALAEMRANAPALVILDLNNPRTDPLGIVADMKGDPVLAGIATVGFVSHVHTELIDAARKAGVGDVMARSMFAERLPQILAKGL
jgi:CheY-like chemotaxis protein